MNILRQCLAIGKTLHNLVKWRIEYEISSNTLQKCTPWTKQEAYAAIMAAHPIYRRDWDEFLVDMTILACMGATPDNIVVAMKQKYPNKVAGGRYAEEA